MPNSAAGRISWVLYQTFKPAGPAARPLLPPPYYPLAENGLNGGVIRRGRSAGRRSVRGDHGLDETALDLPSFVADKLRAVVGARGSVVNAADLMMNPSENGLRSVNEADQLAAFEFAATFTSQGLRNVLAKIEPGMTELQAARLIGMNGLPQSAHPMLTAGRRAVYGLPEPEPRRDQARRSRHHAHTAVHGGAQRPRRLPRRGRDRSCRQT